jgi:hypothetical protein
MGIDKVETFKESTSGFTLSRKLPWEGMKSFEIGKENNQIHMWCADSGLEIIVDGNTLHIKKGGKIARTYRRAGVK